MSAIALHDILEDLETTEVVRSPRRRNHLRVVQPGETAPVVELHAENRMTLTRRGRLAITLTLTTVVVLAVAAAVGWLPAAADGGQSVVVQPGQTLSHIAVAELPEVSLDRAIVQIQLANDLNSLDVQAGTELVIPRP